MNGPDHGAGSKPPLTFAGCCQEFVRSCPQYDTSPDLWLLWRLRFERWFAQVADTDPKNRFEALRFSALQSVEATRLFALRGDSIDRKRGSWPQAEP